MKNVPYTVKMELEIGAFLKYGEDLKFIDGEYKISEKRVIDCYSERNKVINAQNQTA